MPNRGSRQARNRSRNNRRRNRNQAEKSPERNESPDNMKMLQEELRSSALRTGENWDCPVCLDTLNPNEFTFTKCSHKICSKCFSDTRISKCPICREDMGKGDVTPEWESESESEENTISFQDIIRYSERQDEQMGEREVIIQNCMEPPEARPEFHSLYFCFDLYNSITKEWIGKNTYAFDPLVAHDPRINTQKIMSYDTPTNERLPWLALFGYAQLFELGDADIYSNIHMTITSFTNCYNGITHLLKDNYCSPFLLISNERCIERFCDKLFLDILGGEEKYMVSTAINHKARERFSNPEECYTYYRTTLPGRSNIKKKKTLKEHIIPMAICKYFRIKLRELFANNAPSPAQTSVPEFTKLYKLIKGTFPSIFGMILQKFRSEFDEDNEYFFDIVYKYLKHIQRLFVVPPVMGTGGWKIMGLQHIKFSVNGTNLGVNGDFTEEQKLLVDTEYNVPTDISSSVVNMDSLSP